MSCDIELWFDIDAMCELCASRARDADRSRCRMIYDIIALRINLMNISAVTIFLARVVERTKERQWVSRAWFRVRKLWGWPSWRRYSYYSGVYTTEQATSWAHRNAYYTKHRKREQEADVTSQNGADHGTHASDHAVGRRSCTATSLVQSSRCELYATEARDVIMKSHHFKAMLPLCTRTCLLKHHY